MDLSYLLSHLRLTITLAAWETFTLEFLLWGLDAEVREEDKSHP